MPSPRRSDVSWFSSLRPSMKFTLFAVAWFAGAALAWLIVAEN